MLQTWIQKTLEDHFSPSHLEVINESHQHSVAPGSETHFKVIMTSTQMEGLSKVNRHRQLNKALKPAFEQGLHALSLKLYTPEEWKDATVPESPRCFGGSKKDPALS